MNQKIHVRMKITLLSTAFFLLRVHNCFNGRSRYPFRERRDWDVFCQLVALIPGLKDRIDKGDNDELLQISTLV